jgi:hypothetical protein
LVIIISLVRWSELKAKLELNHPDPPVDAPQQSRPIAITITYDWAAGTDLNFEVIPESF